MICREDRRIISVVRGREEIRRAVLEEKARVERARESGEEVGRKPQTLQSSSENRRKSGGEESRRQTGLEEESSRGAMEPNPTAVRTYYRKWNNGKLGALPRLLSPLSPCRIELEELPSLQM